MTIRKIIKEEKENQIFQLGYFKGKSEALEKNFELLVQVLKKETNITENYIVEDNKEDETGPL